MAKYSIQCLHIMISSAGNQIIIVCLVSNDVMVQTYVITESYISFSIVFFVTSYHFMFQIQSVVYFPLECFFCSLDLLIFVVKPYNCILPLVYLSTGSFSYTFELILPVSTETSSFKSRPFNLQLKSQCASLRINVTVVKIAVQTSKFHQEPVAQDSIQMGPCQNMQLEFGDKMTHIFLKF